MPKQLQILNIELEISLRQTQARTFRALARFVGDDHERQQQVEQEAVKIESEISKLGAERHRLESS